MADIMTLGPSGNTIDLLDLTKYRTDGQAGRSYHKVPLRNTRQVTQRDGNLMLAQDDLIGYELSFGVLCLGSTYNDALMNFNAIETRLQLARDYQMGLGGTVVNLTEQWLNMSAGVVYEVLTGVVEEVDKAVEHFRRGRIQAHVTLTLKAP